MYKFIKDSKSFRDKVLSRITPNGKPVVIVDNTYRLTKDKFLCNDKELFSFESTDKVTDVYNHIWDKIKEIEGI